MGKVAALRLLVVRDEGSVGGGYGLVNGDVPTDLCGRLAGLEI
jgi:hypothetical protein